MLLFRIFFYSALTLLFGIQLGLGQAPHTISYQCVLADADGNAVRDGNYDVTFILYDSDSGGRALWKETQTVAVVNGVFNVILGSTAPLELSFDAPYWLGIQVGTADELRPLIELTAAPYSLLAHSVSDNAITAQKIASGAVVRSVNSLTEHVRLAAGNNITISENDTTLIISAQGSGDGGSLWQKVDDDIYYEAGGVGIGLSTPRNLLHLHNSDPILGSPTWMQFTNVTTGTDIADGLRIGVFSAADLTSGDVLMRGKAALRLGAGGAFHLNLRETGALGLGTLSPQGKMDIHYASTDHTNPQLMLTQSNSSFSRLSFYNQDIDDKYWTIAARSHASDVNLSQFNLYYANGANGQNILSLNGNGRVGVGTTSPDSPLHVKDGDAEIKLGTNFTGVKSRVTFIDPSDDDTYIEKLDQGRMRFRTGGSNTRMTITADGNVGIGTTNPGERLDVNGNIGIADKLTRSATGSTNMIPICYGYLRAGGDIIMGSGNFTTVKIATGTYEITVDDETLDPSTHFVMTQPRASFRTSWLMEDGKLEIRTYDDLFVGQDAAVNFIIFKP